MASNILGPDGVPARARLVPASVPAFHWCWCVLCDQVALADSGSLVHWAKVHTGKKNHPTMIINLPAGLPGDLMMHLGAAARRFNNYPAATDAHTKNLQALAAALAAMMADMARPDATELSTSAWAERLSTLALLLACCGYDVSPETGGSTHGDDPRPDRDPGVPDAAPGAAGAAGDEAGAGVR